MPHSDIYQNPDVFFRTQVIIFGAMLVGPAVIVILFVGFVPPDPAAIDPRQGMIITYLVLFASVVAVGAGFLISRARIRNTSAEELENKLAAYSTANLIRWATLEGSLLFSAVAYGATAMPANLVLFGALFVVYIFTFPSRVRFVDQFHLSLDQKDAVLRGK